MKNKYLIFAPLGLISGLITFIFVYFTASLWQNNGFDWVEIAMLSIISGVYFFIAVFLCNLLFTKKMIKKSDMIFNKFYVVFFVLITSFLILIITDSFVYLVDNSISIDFSEGLKEFVMENEEELKSLEDFSKLPFALQNGISTFVFGFFASLLSLLFIKTSKTSN